MKRIFSAVFALILVITMFAQSGDFLLYANAEPGDSVSIVSITPDAVLNYADEVTFTATISYTLQSVDSGIVYLGFNYNEIERYSLVDEIAVSKGSGTVTLTGTLKPAGWGTPESPSGAMQGAMEAVAGKSFGAYANISDSSHPGSWNPLAYVILPIPQGTPSNTTDRENTTDDAGTDTNTNINTDEIYVGDEEDYNTNVKVGDKISFGNYEWQVLDSYDNAVLIILDGILPKHPFDDSLSNNIWQTSTLRKWLNSDFLNEFSAEEQARIGTRNLLNDDGLWSEWYINSGDMSISTDDKVFCLSLPEVLQYFGDSGQLSALLAKTPDKTTTHLWNENDWFIDDQFNIKRTANILSGEYSGTHGYWWLRNPGRQQQLNLIVDSLGRIYLYGVDPDGFVDFHIEGFAYDVANVNQHGGVRPAMWISLNEKNEENIADSKITSDDFLHIGDNGVIKNTKNETVVLRGTNLGSWLLQEYLFTPVVGEDKKWANQTGIDDLMMRGFTEEQIAKIYETYQDNWITEYDIELIAKAGFNVVRVPFWYRNFMYNVNGEYINGSFEQTPGYKRLKWVVDTAGKYGLYVILDMHGAPGGQSLNHTTGQLGRGGLYEENFIKGQALENKCVSAMIKLWTDIAGEFKNNPTVAAYDIMNEPLNNDDYIDTIGYKDRVYSGAERDERAYSVYQAVIPKIRAVDPNHIITIENCFGGEGYPRNFPTPPNGYWRGIPWTNMMYQVHIYEDNYDKFGAQVKETALFCKDIDVACYLGEFNNPFGASICDNMQYDNEVNQAVNWTNWTYKAGNSQESWVKNVSFCWLFIPGLERADLANDSYDVILEKWGECLRTESHDVYLDIDSDKDGIPNDWEINGVTIVGEYLPLQDWGADPYKKDIFVEIDYMRGIQYTPVQSTFDVVAKAFEKHNINLHVDFGKDSTDYVTGKKWGNDSRSNVINYSENFDYETWQSGNAVSRNLSVARSLVFHHCFFVSRTINDNGDNMGSGIADNIGGQNFVINVDVVANVVKTEELKQTNMAAALSGTFMHELGHTLGLGHGGDQCENEESKDVYNNKPNYLSVMNYLFQTGLYDTGEIDYSNYKLPDLDESNLDESRGIDPDGLLADTGLGTIWFYNGNGYKLKNIAKKAINFNKNAEQIWEWLPGAITGNTNADKIENKIKIDINNAGGIQTQLTGFNDWEYLVKTDWGSFDHSMLGNAFGKSSIEEVMGSSSPPIELTEEEYIELIRLINNAETVDLLDADLIQKSNLHWYLGGGIVFLSAVGMVIIIVLKRNRKQPVTSATIICSNCGTQYDIHVKFCGKCGTEIKSQKQF